MMGLLKTLLSGNLILPSTERRSNTLSNGIRNNSNFLEKRSEWQFQDIIKEKYSKFIEKHSSIDDDFMKSFKIKANEIETEVLKIFHSRIDPIINMAKGAMELAKDMNVDERVIKNTNIILDVEVKGIKAKLDKMFQKQVAPFVESAKEFIFTNVHKFLRKFQDKIMVLPKNHSDTVTFENYKSKVNCESTTLIEELKGILGNKISEISQRIDNLVIEKKRELDPSLKYSEEAIQGPHTFVIQEHANIQNNPAVEKNVLAIPSISTVIAKPSNEVDILDILQIEATKLEKTIDDEEDNLARAFKEFIHIKSENFYKKTVETINQTENSEYALKAVIRKAESEFETKALDDMQLTTNSHLVHLLESISKFLELISNKADQDHRNYVLSILTTTNLCPEAYAASLKRRDSIKTQAKSVTAKLFQCRNTLTRKTDKIMREFINTETIQLRKKLTDLTRKKE